MSSTEFVVDAVTGKASIEKDPNASLDYIENWQPWLDGVGDTLAAAAVVATGSDPASTVAVASSIIVGKTVVAWVNGGVAGEKVALRYRITTNNVPPRIDDRTVYLKIKEQ